MTVTILLAMYWKVATCISHTNAGDEKKDFCAWKGERKERGEHSISCQSGSINLDICATETGIVRHFSICSLQWSLKTFAFIVGLSLSFSRLHTLPLAGEKNATAFPRAECSKNLYRLKNMRQRRARWGIFEYPPFTGRITLARIQTRTRHHHHLLLRSSFVFASRAKSCGMNISRSAHALAFY